MRRVLIIVGITIAIIGVAWPWLLKLPLGRLPGDIVVDRPGFRFHFPLGTSILASAVISLIIWLTRR